MAIACLLLYEMPSWFSNGYTILYFGQQCIGWKDYYLPFFKLFFFLIQLVAFNGNMSLLPVHPQQQITDQNHRLDSIWFGHYFDFSQPKRCLFAYEYSIHKDISVCF